MEEEDLPVAGVELDVLRTAPGEGRCVQLELHIEHERLALRDVPEPEREPPVPARLADRARLDRVDRHAFRPAGIEHERRLLQLLARVDVEARAPEQAATETLGRVEVQ